MNKEKLAENIMVMPFMLRKLMKSFPDTGIPRQQLGLLFLIKNENKKPMNYYSEKIMLPKSNITGLADKLAEEGFIERGLDPNDRRVTILEITEKGIQCLQTHKDTMKEQLLKVLDQLDEKDAERMNELFEELKIIFHKIET